MAWRFLKGYLPGQARAPSRLDSWVEPDGYITANAAVNSAEAANAITAVAPALSVKACSSSNAGGRMVPF